jgi:L-serine dehydratase
MTYEFHSGKDILDICARENINISEVMIRNEQERSSRSREAILDEMCSNLEVMRSSIKKGLDPEHIQHGSILGGDAVKLLAYAPYANMGAGMARIAAASMAVVETNAAMGKIVAAPTAGASGILPAVLIECAENQRGFSEDAICEALFTAGAIGCVIAERASIAGASGGCQAETGSAASMAAGALAQLCEASPEMVLTAAAIALKNCLGLVCDPVAGLVECPCIKRNAIGAVNAVLACDMALSGIRSVIPFDEVVSAMDYVGRKMNDSLKETAKGGLAATETGKRIAAQIKVFTQ